MPDRILIRKPEDGRSATPAKTGTAAYVLYYHFVFRVKWNRPAFADDAHAEHTRVLVQARAEILEGPVAPAASPRILELTRRLSVRYLGPGGMAYAEKTLGRPRVLVRLTPIRWRTWTGREWHARYR